MDSGSLLLSLILGGLLGMIGQSIRVVVGLKKTYDISIQNNQTLKENFEGRQLLLSLLIGFVASSLGMIASLNFEDLKASTLLNKSQILQLIAIGYAGTDFIEGFVKKYLPKENGSSDSYKDSQPVNTALPSAPSQGKINQPK